MDGTLLAFRDILFFEWDAAKNRSNIRKHGFDLADVAKLFNREERKDKRAKTAKQDYAPQTFTTRNDVTGIFSASLAILGDVCG